MRDDLFIHVTCLDLTSKSTDNVEMYDRPFWSPGKHSNRNEIGIKNRSVTYEITR